MNKNFVNKTPILFGMALCLIKSIFFLFILANGCSPYYRLWNGEIFQNSCGFPEKLGRIQLAILLASSHLEQRWNFSQEMGTSFSLCMKQRHSAMTEPCLFKFL